MTHSVAVDPLYVIISENHILYIIYLCSMLYDTYVISYDFYKLCTVSDVLSTLYWSPSVAIG